MCIQICTEVLTSCNKARKSYKRYPYCKDANVLLFMDHMLMYIENLMELKKKKKNIPEQVNLSRQQNTRMIKEKRLYFYMLTMNNQKLNLQKQYHAQIISKRKI